ncbi:hypothetical protein BH24ACT2_BH24ACT2_05470 [soil metagenome]
MLFRSVRGKQKSPKAADSFQHGHHPGVTASKSETHFSTVADPLVGDSQVVEDECRYGARKSAEVGRSSAEEHGATDDLQSASVVSATPRGARSPERPLLRRRRPRVAANRSEARTHCLGRIGPTRHLRPFDVATGGRRSWRLPGHTGWVLDWDELEPARVERVVQMLLRDEFGAASLDGSGGDLAQDLRWDSPEGLVIFEVKSFRKRLAGSQKTQVKRSLLRAVGLHAPVRWVLVTRSNPRAPELAWLQSMRPLVPGVTLDWFGRDWLDGCIAGREDLISYVEGPDYKLLRRARHFDVERSAVTTGSELASRHEALVELGEEISPYWRWEFARSDEGHTRTLVPKRPESVTVDPIVIAPTFTFPTDDPEARELAERLHDTLRVGGDVTIPGRFIERVSVTASSEATQRLVGDKERDVGYMEIVSLPDTSGLPLSMSLIRQPSNSHPPVQLPLVFDQRLAGSGGQTLFGSDIHHVIAARLVLEEDGSRVAGKLTITLGPMMGRLPHEVLPVLRLLTGLSETPGLDLYIGPLRVARFAADDGWPLDLRGLHRLVAALDVIQQHLQILLPIPEQHVEPSELRDLSDIAAALAGGRPRLHYSGFNATLRPSMLPVLG